MGGHFSAAALLGKAAVAKRTELAYMFLLRNDAISPAAVRLTKDEALRILETGEAAVSLDLWNLFRTGELVAGRVRIVGPAITVVRLADGRIRLLGQRERPADRPPFDLDRLPAGRQSSAWRRTARTSDPQLCSPGARRCR